MASETLTPIDMRAAPKVLWRITRLALRHPARLAFAAFGALGTAIASVAMPALLGRAVDEAHSALLSDSLDPHAARMVLLRTAALMLGAGLLRGLLSMIHAYQGEIISQRVGYALRLAFFEKLQRLSFAYHDRVHSGDLITRGMLDLEGARVFIQAGLLQGTMLVLLIGVGTYLLLSTDLLMGALALSFLPFAGWRAARLGYLLRVTWLRLQELMSVLTLVMEENLQGIRVVRAFSAKVFELTKFDEAAASALALANRRITLRTSNMTAMTLAYFASMGVVLWVGGHAVIDGRMTVGRLAEYLAFMTILQTPIRQLTMVVNAMARGTSSGGRLFEVLDLEPEVLDKPDAPALAVEAGILRFENVEFSYEREPGPKRALSDISFEVGPGKILGIIGPPGSGKSTIAHLIPRFYDVTGGRVTIDGHDVRDVKLDSLRKTVAVIQQDAFLFDTTARNNVAYPDPWADEERIVDAASTAQIHDYLADLPERYETRVGERGVALSGGQRQRLSIARAILADPSIIIFDDSTAAIDAVTERRIRTALREATRHRTTVIIAHRLSSVTDADEILVLDAGRIVERGTHEALLALGGHYQALHDMQARPVAPAPRERQVGALA